MTVNSSPIDLRSDTVTRPSEGMRRAMMEAPLGDDVLGDEPTVIALQQKVAALLGKEAACFVPSGTMANTASIRALTEPGDEIICHKDSHIIHYETGGAAAISGCMIWPIDSPRGMFDWPAVEERIRADNHHNARSRLLVIENTHNRGGGSVWTLEQVRNITAKARERGLRCHLDGVRLWNACVASGVAPREYAACFDTISTCFSKGLGTPAGSTVAGDKATIARVLRIRKMLGGAMRQSGILAGAAIYALDNNFKRLAEDHTNARLLAEGLARVRGLTIDLGAVQTNIVYVGIEAALGAATDFCAKVRELGVWVLPTGKQQFRAVTHLDVSREMIERAIGLFVRAAS